MAGVKPACSAALLLVTACGTAWAADPNVSGAQGFVEDGGAPVAGALISVFGTGLGGTGLFTFSDDDGRFALPTLPVGSYTLRTLVRNRRPAARKITVLPNQRAYFAVNLANPAFERSALGEGVEVAAETDAPAPSASATLDARSEASRELRWRVRHRRRSVLEARAAGDRDRARRADLSSTAPAEPAELGGRLDVVAAATALGEDAAASAWDWPAGFGLLRLDGRLADNVTWSLGGLLAESDERAWRMATEFVIEPAAGHQLEAGSGYGSGVLRPTSRGRQVGDPSERGAGVLFARDTFEWTRELQVSAGVRWSYLGFLRDDNYFDPSAAVAWQRGRHSVQASAAVHTLSPGGDLLTLSSLSTAPPVTYAEMDAGLRAERITRYELALASGAGGLTLGARAFREGTRDQLVNLFDDQDGLRILNAPGVVSTGFGVSLARRLGRAVSGSVEYAAGVARRGSVVETTLPGDADVTRLFVGDARFHDVVARIETLVDRSDTRIVAYYRINVLTPEDGVGHTQTRFDVQLNQGLPFMTTLTRADWELLLAFRNLFYEESEGGLLDEAAVRNPPKRVVGGISVRF